MYYLFMLALTNVIIYVQLRTSKKAKLTLVMKRVIFHIQIERECVYVFEKEKERENRATWKNKENDNNLNFDDSNYLFIVDFTYFFALSLNSPKINMCCITIDNCNHTL